MAKDVTQQRSIPSLDGLRGVAVLLVIIAHLGYMDRMGSALARHHLASLGKLFEVEIGDLGVSIFFVISGYLITTLLLRHQDGNGQVSLKNFYARRFFRIFPPYYFYLLIVGILWWVHLVPMNYGALFSSAFYVSNYYPYLLSQPSTQGWLVGHTWSLSFEEQFYLIWPACLHWLGRKRSAWLGCALILLSPILRMLTLHVAPGSASFGQVDRMFHSRVDTIMAGCVLALIGVWPRAQAILVSRARSKGTGVFAALSLLVVVYECRQHFIAMQVFGIGIEAVLLAYLIFYAITNADTWGGRFLNQPWLRHIGVISYSLYLWQQLWTGHVQIGGNHPLWMRLLLILACAETSYFLIERPSFRVRDWYIAQRLKKPIVMSSFAER
jgi:peptidoglycan/LPS O-acetylase OafA/YrhL